MDFSLILCKLLWETKIKVLQYSWHTYFIKLVYNNKCECTCDDNEQVYQMDCSDLTRMESNYAINFARFHMHIWERKASLLDTL